MSIHAAKVTVFIFAVFIVVMFMGCTVPWFLGHVNEVAVDAIFVSHLLISVPSAGT